MHQQQNQEQSNTSNAQHKPVQAKQHSTQAKHRPIQAKQRLIQARHKPIQAKQKPVQAKQRPVQRTTIGQTKKGQPQGSAKFQEIATTMGQQHGVDTTQLKATHNSSFPDTVNAEATIQGNKIDFAPGKDTEANMKHEVAHAIDNAKNGTPKGDKTVNGQNVDTTREQVVDNMAAQPLQRKENQHTSDVVQQGGLSSGGPVQRKYDERHDRKIRRIVNLLENNREIDVHERAGTGDVTDYFAKVGVVGNEEIRHIAYKKNGTVYFLYGGLFADGFDAPIEVSDDNQPVVILGKFAPDWNNPNSLGVRLLLGGNVNDRVGQVSGLPDGLVGHVRGGGGFFTDDTAPIKALSLPHYFRKVNRFISQAVQKRINMYIDLGDTAHNYSNRFREIKAIFLKGWRQMSTQNIEASLNEDDTKIERARAFSKVGLTPNLDGEMLKRNDDLSMLDAGIREGLKLGDQAIWSEDNLSFLRAAFANGAIVRLVSDSVKQKTGFYAKEVDAIFGTRGGKQVLGLAQEYGYIYDERKCVFRPSTTEDAPRQRRNPENLPKGKPQNL
ncbi:hypothetical protein BKI52_14730 [marine bacterium AO1-C]|nr:hypothetical protein BKI52_14730 [marine bacterium AO1-C]